MFGKKEPPKQETAIKRGGFGVHKKPPAPPAPEFKDLKANCVFSNCRGKVRNTKGKSGKNWHAKCDKCKQVYRYMPRTMKPKIWYTSFGPTPS